MCFVREFTTFLEMNRMPIRNFHCDFKFGFRLCHSEQALNSVPQISVA